MIIVRLWQWLVHFTNIKMCFALEEGIFSNSDSVYQQVKIQYVTCVTLSRGKFLFVMKNRMFLLFRFKCLCNQVNRSVNENGQKWRCGLIWREGAPCVFHAVNTPQELGRNLHSEQSLRFVMETLELYSLYLRGPLDINRRGRYALGSYRWRYAAWRRWDNAGRRRADRSATLLHQFRDLLRLIFTRLLLDFGIPNVFRHLKREPPCYSFLSPVEFWTGLGITCKKKLKAV